MWGWVLRAAIVVGLDKWAKKKATGLITKIKGKAKTRMERLEAVRKVANAVASLSATDPSVVHIHEKGDVHRPGQVVYHDGLPYRITRLISVGSEGAVYEARRQLES